MQLDQIETFLDLCETKNFNRTAERLGLTQSTVSGRVKALEEALGCRLLNRSRAGTELTTEGLQFEPHARSLRLSWSDAREAVRDVGDAALRLRLGMQHDIAGQHVGEWIDALRQEVPQASIYFEADHSLQMCNDLISGALDIGILYTPRPLPDLYFESLGEVRYVMVSTNAPSLDYVVLRQYVLGNFAPAFASQHAALYPALSTASLTVGQSAVIAGIFRSIGGTGYVLEDMANTLLDADLVRIVDGAEVIPQMVYGAMHMRNRHRGLYRRVMRALGQQVLETG